MGVAVEQNKAHIRADKLQQLHTLHNLADLLGQEGIIGGGGGDVPGGSRGARGGVPGVAPTLRDSQLAAEAGELRCEDSAAWQQLLLLAGAAGCAAARTVQPAAQCWLLWPDSPT